MEKVIDIGYCYSKEFNSRWLESHDEVLKSVSAEFEALCNGFAIGNRSELLKKSDEMLRSAELGLQAFEVLVGMHLEGYAIKLVFVSGENFYLRDNEKEIIIYPFQILDAISEPGKGDAQKDKEFIIDVFKNAIYAAIYILFTKEEIDTTKLQNFFLVESVSNAVMDIISDKLGGVLAKSKSEDEQKVLRLLRTDSDGVEDPLLLISSIDSEVEKGNLDPIISYEFVIEEGLLYGYAYFMALYRQGGGISSIINEVTDIACSQNPASEFVKRYKRLSAISKLNL
ncbi:MAG: hypothetical protein ACP5SA_00975 [Candidatus Micrarchaeia archaeon]